MMNTMRPLLAACVGGLTVWALALRRRDETAAGSAWRGRYGPRIGGVRAPAAPGRVGAPVAHDVRRGRNRDATRGFRAPDVRRVRKPRIVGQLNEPPRTTATSGPFLRCAGRVVIDTARQALILQDIEGHPPSEGPPPELAVSPVRYYTFDGNLLRTSVRDAGDHATAELTWQRLD